MIRSVQLPSGQIPWHTGGKTDPWDHVESAMGLAVGGHIAAAERAFDWLAQTQLADGSWYAATRNGQVEDATRESNHAAYAAVGVWHHYRLTGNRAFLRRLWPTVAAGIDFSLGLQAAGGEIFWAVSPQERVDPMALLTGCSSICMSLKCALAIAERLGRRPLGWPQALERLVAAIRHKPWLFNMTKSRFAMDWFYPVLCGALAGPAAQKRLDRQWKKFVVEGQGVRCVSDAPWVTVAETAELVLALSAADRPASARILFGWMCEKRFEDGTFWCGHTFPDMVVWPAEKITWTNAAVLLAADALFGLTPAAALFSHADPLQARLG
jgi:hypothetical protein